jgi:hypothetical protein
MANQPITHGNPSADRSLIEINALSLGWHIGFYRFVLAAAGKSETGELGPDDQQVLRIIRSRINELARFFNLDAVVAIPNTPAEARTYFANLGREVESKSGSNFVDILSTHYGKEVASLYSFGMMIMTYALIAPRREPELQSEIMEMREQIRQDSDALGISRTIVEEYLLRPQDLASPSVVERIAQARAINEEQPTNSAARQIPRGYSLNALLEREASVRGRLWAVVGVVLGLILAVIALL